MKTIWNEPFNQAVEVLKVLEKNGYEAYFVGGCVRDLLLKREIKDIDIASSATPNQITKLFDAVIPVGLQHGTVLVRYKDTSYEITTFRGKYNQDKAMQKIALGIKEDLEYRDFTINAMAMDQSGKIIDYFSGRTDLEKKVISSVKNPVERFLEDPLRILRAIRFVSQLEFTIEPETLKQMDELKHHLESVSVERITAELKLIFEGSNVQEALDYMNRVEVYKHIPVWMERPELFQKIPNKLTSFVSLAEVIALFHHLDHRISISTWVNRWKCSNKTKRDAHALYHALTYYLSHKVDNWLVYTLPKETKASFVHLIYLLTNQSIDNELIKQYEKLPISNRAELAINGSDLKEIFNNQPSGKWIKDGIEAIEYEVVMGKLKNNKTVIKEWILCHPPVIN